MLTLKEAAAKLRISDEALRLKINAGEIEAMKAGSGRTSPWRITEEVLADFIKRHTVRATR
jgi:excisionase family DNA binding protein